MKRIVKVSESNIRLGRKRCANGKLCIIYRALRTAFKGKIDYCGFSYFQLTDGRRINLPREAKAIQRQVFAETTKKPAVLKPFTFTVDF